MALAGGAAVWLLLVSAAAPGAAAATASSSRLRAPAGQPVPRQTVPRALSSSSPVQPPFCSPMSSLSSPSSSSTPTPTSSSLNRQPLQPRSSPQPFLLLLILVPASLNCLSKQLNPALLVQMPGRGRVKMDESTLSCSPALSSPAGSTRALIDSFPREDLVCPLLPLPLSSEAVWN